MEQGAETKNAGGELKTQPLIGSTLIRLVTCFMNFSTSSMLF